MFVNLTPAYVTSTAVEKATPKSKSERSESNPISYETVALIKEKRRLKPDFHSHISLVASEFFRTGHAQSGETNRSGRKNIFRSVCI